jgi:hypothetical protein
MPWLLALKSAPGRAHWINVTIGRRCCAAVLTVRCVRLRITMRNDSGSELGWTLPALMNGPEYGCHSGSAPSGGISPSHASQNVATSIICVRPSMCVDTVLRCTLSSIQANSSSACCENARYIGVCLASRPARPVAGDSRPEPNHHAGGPGTGCVRPLKNDRALEEAEPGRVEPELGRPPWFPPYAELGLHRAAS